jgi:hypothetical protein
MTTKIITQEEITAGNIVIGEFYGFKQKESTDWKRSPITCYYDPTGQIRDSRADIELMSFHNSWEWLMPVIEKLALLPIHGAQTHVDTFYPRTFGMISESGEYLFRYNAMPLHSSPLLILAAWAATVELVTSINQYKG